MEKENGVLETQITEHVKTKVVEMETKAKTATKWYKKLGYYVAAAVGAVVIQVVNTYGNDIFQMVKTTLESMF